MPNGLRANVYFRKWRGNRWNHNKPMMHHRGGAFSVMIAPLAPLWLSINFLWKWAPSLCLQACISGDSHVYLRNPTSGTTYLQVIFPKYAFHNRGNICKATPAIIAFQTLAASKTSKKIQEDDKQAFWQCFAHCFLNSNGRNYFSYS